MRGGKGVTRVAGILGSVTVAAKAHPVVPGSSTYRGGGRNLKRGWVSSFRGALSRLSACRWQFYGLFARAGLSRRRSLVAAQCPLAPAAAGRRTASSYHISGYLGQRDEPSPIGCLEANPRNYRLPQNCNRHTGGGENGAVAFA